MYLLRAYRSLFTLIQLTFIIITLLSNATSVFNSMKLIHFNFRFRRGQPEKMSNEKSIHSAGIGEIHIMPIDEIIRPIPSVLDPAKVNAIAETLQTDPQTIPPIDVKNSIYCPKNRFNLLFSFSAGFVD